MSLLLLTRGGEGQWHVPGCPNKAPDGLWDMTVGECDVVHGVEELIGRRLRFHCREVSPDAKVATKRERHVVGGGGTCHRGALVSPRQDLHRPRSAYSSLGVVQGRL